jgi:hypothetical protein
MRTLKTARIRGTWALPQVKAPIPKEVEETKQESPIREIEENKEETQVFKEGDKVMLKAPHFFFPPTLAHKAWYGAFTVTRVCNSNLVEIWDHTIWYAKVNRHELKHVGDYLKEIKDEEYEPALKRFKGT